VASVLITTPQRSGSHFMTYLLQKIGIAGHGEFPKLKHPEAWHSTLGQMLPINKTSSVIMHPNLFYDVKSAGKWLFESERFRVLHGRRAPLMVLSDALLAKAAREAFGKPVSNPGKAKRGKQSLDDYWLLTARNQLPAGPELAEHVRRGEALDALFQSRLGFTAASNRFFVYDYEQLLLRHRVAHLVAILGFIFSSTVGTVDMAERIFNEYELDEAPPLPHTLHPTTCSSRVNWQALRPLLNGTRTLLMCDRLEARFGAAEQAKRDEFGDRLIPGMISQKDLAKEAAGLINGLFGRGVQ